MGALRGEADVTSVWHTKGLVKGGFKTVCIVSAVPEQPDHNTAASIPAQEGLAAVLKHPPPPAGWARRAAARWPPR